VGDSLLGCPKAPSQCEQSGGLGGAVAGTLMPVYHKGFKLIDSGDSSEWEEIVDEIAAISSVQTVKMTSVAVDLNRTGDWMGSFSSVDCYDDGFEWNSGDNDVDYWWPQGVTGSADAYHQAWESGTIAGKKMLLVAWYHKPGEDSSTSSAKGVRVSLVDVTGSGKPKYRHMLLAEPSWTAAGTPTMVPLASSNSSLHAGGIVWYRNWLYVADTSSGVRVFDLDNIFKVETPGEKNTLGMDPSSGKFLAFGYRYVVPQVRRYVHCESACCARFSTLSMDASTTPPSLTASEYHKSDYTARIHRWPLNPDTGLLEEQDGAVHAMEAMYAGAKKIQGALCYDDTCYLSSSGPKVGFYFSSGSLHHGEIGGSLTPHQYPYLPEDLYLDTFTSALWTCTEAPDGFLDKNRFCFHVPLYDVPACN